MVVTLVKNDPDSQWFHSYPDRQSHIRNPIKILMTDKQRGTHYVDELAGEFWSLGDHNKDRRRILLLKVPFLLFGDESVEDTDAVLLPILHEIMTDAARKTR